MINDKVRMSTSANLQVAAIFAVIMVIRQNPYSNLGEGLIKNNPI